MRVGFGHWFFTGGSFVPKRYLVMFGCHSWDGVILGSSGQRAEKAAPEHPLNTGQHPAARTGLAANAGSTDPEKLWVREGFLGVKLTGTQGGELVTAREQEGHRTAREKARGPRAGRPWEPGTTREPARAARDEAGQAGRDLGPLHCRGDFFLEARRPAGASGQLQK